MIEHTKAPLLLIFIIQPKNLATDNWVGWVLSFCVIIFFFTQSSLFHVTKLSAFLNLLCHTFFLRTFLFVEVIFLSIFLHTYFPSLYLTFKFPWRENLAQ